jgi:hypothetical protein
MSRRKPVPERQGFEEDAPGNTTASEQQERETPPARHLNSLEQQTFHAALRRSVKVISR